MWTYIILGLGILVVAYFYLQKQKTKKQDRNVLQKPPWEEPDRPALKPPEVPTKPQTKPPVAIKTPVKRVPRPVKRPKSPVLKAPPKGWYRADNGQIYRNADPKALWNTEVARKTVRIDFALVGNGKILEEQDLGNVRLDRLALNVFKMPDTDFSASMSTTTLLTQAAMYLCDKTGRVYSYALSIEGKYKHEVFIKHKAGSYKGGPYIVQASNGISAESTFLRPRGK